MQFRSIFPVFMIVLAIFFSAPVCSDPVPDQIPSDTDADGILDEQDNCITRPNPSQLDTDLDTVGDLCDNCPSERNSDQADSDIDGKGDACQIFVRVTPMFFIYLC